MYEVFVLVEKKRSLIMKLCFVLSLFVTVFFLILTILGASVFMAMVILFGTLTWFINRRCIEFEYSYFDGEMRFTKIISKSKRKAIKMYNMDDVLTIAPSGDRSVYNYENNRNLPVRDLTSGREDAAVYVMVAKSGAGQELVKFEPDEDLLNAVCMKYGHKVKK